MLELKYIKAIHTAKSKAGLSEDEYRAMLSGYGVDTSKKLNSYQAIEILNKISPKSSSSCKIEFEKRPDHLATQKQLNMLKAVWRVNSRTKDVISLDAFVKRIVKVDKLNWLLKKDVQRIKLAIESLT